MLELNAHAFYNAVNGINYLELKIREQPGGVSAPGGSDVIAITSDDSFKSAIESNFSELRRELITLGANIALAELERVSSSLSAQSLTWEELKSSAKEIRSRLGDELSSVKLLAIDSNKRDYFAPALALFGPQFEAGFQSAGAFELDEAAKCFALSRPTAAVFHLMRLMEVGIRAVSRCLDIPDPTKPAERNWGKILQAVREDGIDKKWPKMADRMSGDGQFFESLYVSLDAVKNPWRNATMHVENKYTDDEAQHIFFAVKGFMKKIASRMDEEGNPKA
jgi:hypothetical protein